MYSWYANARACVVYLSDILKKGVSPYVHDEFKESRWFRRGWTLQELLAPTVLCFCDANWDVFGHICAPDPRSSPTADIDCGLSCCLGQRAKGPELSREVSEITKIPRMCLRDHTTVPRMSTAQKMSWASRRSTSRIEDEAYCLLGVFGVNMPLIYGEGRAAFFRLQQEITKDSADQSIFAWMRDSQMSDPRILDESRGFPYQLAPLFARSPEDFGDSGRTLQIIGHLKTAVRALPFTLTNLGLQIQATLVPVSASNMSNFDTFLMKLRVDPGKKGGSKYYYEVALIRMAEAYGENRFARLYTGDMGSVVYKDGVQSIEQLVYIDTGCSAWHDIFPFLAVRDSLVQKHQKLTVPITTGGR